MSKKKTYDEIRVIAALSKKRSITIDRSSKTIKIIPDNMEVGNGSWGKIDYLCHYCGYHWMYSSKGATVVHVNSYNESKKETKRAAKPTAKGIKISKKLRNPYAEL